MKRNTNVCPKCKTDAHLKEETIRADYLIEESWTVCTKCNRVKDHISYGVVLIKNWKSKYKLTLWGKINYWFFNLPFFRFVNKQKKKNKEKELPF